MISEIRWCRTLHSFLYNKVNTDNVVIHHYGYLHYTVCCYLCICHVPLSNEANTRPDNSCRRWTSRLFCIWRSCLPFFLQPDMHKTSSQHLIRCTFTSKVVENTRTMFRQLLSEKTLQQTMISARVLCYTKNANSHRASSACVFKNLSSKSVCIIIVSQRHHTFISSTNFEWSET